MANLETRQIYTYGDSVYLLSAAATWVEAQTEAQSFGGNLVTVNDGAEQTFLAGLFAGKTLWTGYSDVAVEGNFQWADGDSSTYTNWASGQPNNFRNEDFVAIDSNGSWNDISDTAKLQGIIEIKNPTTPILTVSDLSIIEPPEGSKQAVFSVRRYGNSSQQTTVNYSTADDTAVAGTNYVATSGTLTFNPGETEKTIRVTINADADVTSGETFVLNLSTPTNAILGDNQAKATILETTDAITFGDSTYVLTNPGNWGEAQEQARAFGGNLVTINNAEEQTFLAGAYAGQNLWIGYSDAGKEYDPTTKEGFEWVSGTSAYTNWADGQPNDFRGEDFVILGGNGNWNDVAGTGRAQGIVEIPGALSQPLADLTTKQIYTYEDSIYFLSDVNNWGLAQAEAQTFQGNLVTINDGAEQTFLAGLFAGNNLWTGYSDAGVEGDFRWVDGDSSTYTHWAAGQPNNFREEDFVILSGNGNWDDVAGTGKAQGIVEIKNPETPILVIENLSIIEPENGTKQAVFSVRRYGNSTGSASVRYSTADDTAIAGTNYTATSGTLTFAPGETEKTISVTINADTNTISGETFFLNLDTPTNALLGRNQAKATLREASETVTFGDSTYLLTNPGNWGEAQEQARTFGGNLVTINSAEEQTFLAETYAGQNLWIGYSDAGQEYDPTTQEGFKWIADTSAYTNWLAGQPNNFREENFVILSNNGAWNDVSGTGRAQGIIEIPKVSPPDISGEIQGIKWNDLNANGVRDSIFPGGDNPDIAFVIDVSDSTKNNLFAGSPVGDLNNDSLANTRLDAEIAGFLTLNQQLIDLGLGDTVDVSIIAYGESAANADMNLVADDLQLSTTPNADADGNGIADVEDILRSISVGAFGTGLATNPEAALQQVEKTFDDLGTADGDGNVIVLTDGEQTRGGDITDEVERLLDRNANLKAFGVGNDAELEIIQTIDPDGVKFTSTDELLNAFNDLSNGGNSFIEPGLAGVTIYVDTNNNRILDAGEPTQISATDNPNTPDIDETGQYSFENLAPGTYTVREVVPVGFRQTFPNNGVGGTNLITNGSFEEGPDPGNGFLRFSAGSTEITDWTVTAETVDLVGTQYRASDGLSSLDLDGATNAAGGIAQTFETTIGERYLVSFDLAGNVGRGPRIKTARVDVADVSQDFEYDSIGQSFATLEYDQHSFEFIATESETTLQFSSLTGSGWGPNIDNVSVVNVESDGGFHTVEIGQDGNVVENINFGNTQFQSGVIQGTKWNDLNGDGIRNGNNQSGSLETDILGPLQPYSSFEDSPFNGLDFSEFYLEDFEDLELNTPGVSASPGRFLGIPMDLGVANVEDPRFSTIVDSVDGDDGEIDGNGSFGSSFVDRNNSRGASAQGVRFTFDANELGYLPTHAGVVWTESTPLDTLIFEAFDADGNSLGQIETPTTFDRDFSGDAEDDLFFGAVHVDGISAIVGYGTIENLNAFEVDHLQYGIINQSSSITESGLSGVTVYLDDNNNGVLDAGEPTQITAEDNPNTPNIDETGQYAFENLAPGTYTVREVVPDGFEQTFPNNGVVGNNLVLNGGFEDGPAIRNEIINVTSGSAVIPNWAVTAGQVDLVADLTYPAAAGAVSLDLNGYSTGEIQQTINTTVGEQYLLTFDLAGNPGGTPTIKMGQVEVAGITADLTYDISGQLISSLDYVPTALEFTATDSQTVLTFRSLVPGAYGPNIDNVSVVKIAPNAGFHTVEIGEDSNIIENINFGNTQLIDRPGPGDNTPPVAPDQLIVGTDGRDTLTGTENDDMIIGKGSSDRLTGNGGSDQFVFQSIDDRIDRINDFEVAADKIMLTDLFDDLGVSLDSYDQAINQGYLGITSFGRDDSRIRIDIDGLNGSRGARTLAIAYDVTPTELSAADNFVI
ncbi:MAG: choice-of-anchor C family protein [Cyanobacteria bacterium P01_B01_bin.77]